MHANKIDKSINLQKSRFETKGAKLLNIQVQDCLCHLQTTKRCTERTVFLHICQDKIDSMLFIQFAIGNLWKYFTRKQTNTTNTF